MRRTLLTVVLCALATGVCAASAQEPAPREVEIGLLLADLSNVDGSAQSFDADVFLVALWNDPALAGGDEVRTLDLDDVWHPTLLIFNQRDAAESMPAEVTVQPDGTVTYLQRFTGEFSSRMNLREFPFDRQEFSVWVVAPARLGAEVALVPYEDLAALRVANLSISDWEIGDPTLSADAFQLGPDSPLNPGIRLTIPATRRVTYYVIQVLIPLVAIVLMAYSVFWVSPSVVPTRMGVVVTTMLTLIAYRFMLANLVPRLSYLTRLDWFMLGATMIVLLTLFTMAGTSYLTHRGQEALVGRIDRIGRFLFPIAFAAYSLIVLLG